MFINYDGREAQAIMNQFLSELEKVRVKMELIVFKYTDSKKARKVCYLLGMDHPFQDVASRMQSMDKNKSFSVDEVRNILKLSEGKGKKNVDQFGEWDRFFQLYCKWYPRQTINCKYTLNNKNNIKNFVYAETKEQAILVRMLLDFFSNQPTFISKNLKIGEALDLPM